MNALDNISKEIRTGNVTKASIQEQANRLTESVRSGDMEAYKLYAELKAIAEVVAAAQKEIYDQATEELFNAKEGLIVHGMRLTCKQGARRYDYKHIPEWAAKKAELSEIEEAAKIAANNYGKKALVDQDSGEMVTPAKVTYNKYSVNVEIPKG